MSTYDLPDLTQGIKTVTYPLGQYFAVFIRHTLIYGAGVKLLSLTALKLIAICTNEQCEYMLVVVNKKAGTQEVRFNSNHSPGCEKAPRTYNFQLRSLRPLSRHLDDDDYCRALAGQKRGGAKKLQAKVKKEA